MTCLSKLHADLANITRDRNAERLNKIVNDPSVYRWVKGAHTDALDLSEVVSDNRNILLMGAFGGIMFIELQAGLYEAHTQVLREGRGEWALSMTRAALHWMFTRSPAIEIMTKVPKGNIAAKALARAVGGRFEFRAENAWVMNGTPVSAEIWTLTLQEWAKQALGLVERGQWFHERLDDEFARLGITEPNHDDDEVHDRYVGLAAEMIFGEQTGKAQVFYNRWARMAGYEPITVSPGSPVFVDIGSALLSIGTDNFEVISCL